MTNRQNIKYTDKHIDTYKNCHIDRKTDGQTKHTILEKIVAKTDKQTNTLTLLKIVRRDRQTRLKTGRWSIKIPK